jgi:hypothetical protein
MLVWNMARRRQAPPWPGGLGIDLSIEFLDDRIAIEPVSVV